ncbi:MAG: GyrI-like domain-containing protein [Gemmatimonadetes bacterium]|nr:GyrI-like domain-containing protein [Gemmatimonadota bacterium]
MSEVELTQQSPRHFVGIRRKVHTSDLPGFFAEVLPKVMNWIQGQKIAPASAPMAMWCAMDMESGIADTHAGCFVENEVEGAGEITPGVTSGGDVLRLIHRGGYGTVGQSWGRVYEHAKALGRRPGAGWEIYIDDPGEVEADDLRTEIYLPVG